MTTAHTDLREDKPTCICQEMLATGIARGRHEEHLHACKMIRRVIVEIADVRFPLIAAFIQERVERMDHFVALHQFTFIISTAWASEDVLRFLIALDDAQDAM